MVKRMNWFNLPIMQITMEMVLVMKIIRSMRVSLVLDSLLIFQIAMIKR